MQLWAHSFVLFLLLWGIVSCGGEDPGSSIPLDLPVPAPEVIYPALGGRYVAPTSRLDFPTPPPAPVPTPRPTLDLSQLARSRAFSSVVAPVADYGGLSCEEHYRRLLVEYEGREIFGPLVVMELSNSLVDSRPDCDEAGWSPQIGLEAVCIDRDVAGLLISEGLIRFEGSFQKPVPLATGRDDEGNMLLHFRKLPLREEVGCWYYDARLRAWGWVIGGVGEGVIEPSFPACVNFLEREIVRRIHDGLGPVDVARAIDDTRMEVVGCGNELWDIYPGSAPLDGCLVSGFTGVLPNGGALVNWHRGYLPADGSVCWVYDPYEMSWDKHVPPPEG